jgi:hypothetical protein
MLVFIIKMMAFVILQFELLQVDHVDYEKTISCYNPSSKYEEI